MTLRKGKLIVIEGIDGSGKTTQIELLKKYLASQGVSWETISFPQYGKNKYATYIYDYLSGKFGKLNDVEVHDLANKYAEDRKTVKELINHWLETGILVITNRYIASSKAHLGAHLPENKRAEFIKWIDQLEYKENKMPKEDLTILLDVNPTIGQKNSKVKNHPDLHEDDLNHLEKARQIFLELSKEKSWVVVECMEDGLPAGRQGKMKSPEEINQTIVKLLQDMVLSA